LEPEELDCEPVPVWLLEEVVVVDVVALGCAKTPPMDESAATTEVASIEYAKMLRLLVLKPILKLMFSFHLPATFDPLTRITKFRERPQIAN
jgi:hypothetical protein